MEEGKKCSCLCHKMFPLLVVVVGVDFLLGNLGIISIRLMNIIWPIILILIGLQKLFSSKCKCCTAT